MTDAPRCRWDRDTETYRVAGEPCTEPHHCQHRRSCAVHVEPGVRTCPRCVGRVRRDIRAVATLAALMPAEASVAGLRSTALTYAGPAADPRGHLERKLLASRRNTYAYLSGDIDGDEYLKRLQAEDADDGTHPTNILGAWTLMLAEHYGHHLPSTRLTLTWCASYLERHLTQAAQDPDVDLPQLHREVKATRTRVEQAIRAHRQTEHGAPCPACVEETGKGPRLRRTWGHWCEDPDCEKMHYDDETGDWWVCPRNPDHRWDEATYRLRIADVYAEHTAS